jgi:hypothetical protein
MKTDIQCKLNTGKQDRVEFHNISINSIRYNSLYYCSNKPIEKDIDQIFSQLIRVKTDTNQG